jgi:hypothetical protein
VYFEIKKNEVLIFCIYAKFIISGSEFYLSPVKNFKEGSMLDKIIKQFKHFELKEDLEFVFDKIPYVYTDYRVSLLNVSKLKKYVEFFPEAEYYITVKKKGWKDEALKVFTLPTNVYLILYLPKDTKAIMKSYDYPFILIERKIEEKDTWEPVSYLYYYNRVYNGLHLTSKPSVETVIEVAIKSDWEVEI